MAVLDSLPGLAVSVSVAAKELPEYECRDEEPNGPLANITVLRYIESTSDAEFAIKFQLSPPFQLTCAALTFKVYIDGQAVSGKLCEQKGMTHGHWARLVFGDKSVLQDGRTELRKFRFASVKTVEDADNERIRSDAVKFSLVGQMTIKVFRISALGRGNRAHSHRSKERVRAEVAEKAIKGKSLSHCTAYSSPVPVKSSRACDVTYLDGPDKPIAIFDFRYLSKKALRQQLIIPRSPSPDPFNALTEAAKERLGRQMLAELRARNAKVEVKSERKIKRERDAEGEVEMIDLSGESLVANVPARPLKMIKMVDGKEAIDLTD